VVRTERNAAELTGAIRDVLRSIDADPLLSVRTGVAR
jgi:hypothetical protein